MDGGGGVPRKWICKGGEVRKVDKPGVGGSDKVDKEEVFVKFVAFFSFYF